MSTRFYFPITGTPDILPAFDATWNLTASAFRCPLVTTKGSSGTNNSSITETSTSNTYDILHGQYISAPLSPQTISGTLSCVARSREGALTGDLISQLVVRVVSNDGSVVRGTLIAPTAATAPGTSNVEFTDSTPKNQLFPSAANTGTTAAVASVTCESGDRIVVEIGSRATNTVSSAVTSVVELGESTSADLALDQTSSSTGSPWIEFYKTIEFLNGPTKLYFPSTGTPEITPAFHAEWEATASAVRRPLSYPKGGSAFATVAAAETTATNLYDVGLAQFVSAPLAAQTISGTLSCVIRCSQSNLAANMTAQMAIRVVSGDGSTVRGTLISPTTVTTVSTSTQEWATSLRNQYFPSGDVSSATLTSVTCQSGDRLVVEIGYRAINTVTTSYTGTMEFGESAASDLALNQSGTTQGTPWLSFSQKVQFTEAVSSFTTTSASTLAALTSQAVGYFGEVILFEATSDATLPMIYTESTIGGPGPSRTIEAAFTLPDYYFTGSAWRIPPRVIDARIQAPKYYFSSTARAADDSVLVSSRIIAPKYYFSATGTAS
jgi:hypothetical protein